MDEEEARGPRAMSMLGAAGWALLVEVVFAIVLQAVEGARGGTSADLVTLTIGRVLAYALVLFAILRVHEPESPIREVLAVRGARPLHVLFGLVIGASLSPGASFVNELVTKRYPPTEAETEAMERLLAAHTVGQRVAVVLTLGLVLPVADELFFRGVLFGRLERSAPRRRDLVVLATAVLDTVVLASVRGVPSMFVTALALGLLRARAHSAVPAAAARVAFFLVSLGSIALGKPEWEPSWRAALGSAAVGALALASFVALTRSRPVGCNDDGA